jgi:hypothetical protein
VRIVRPRAERRAIEARWRHADNGQRLPVDDERFTEDWRAIETRIPERVAQDGDRRAALAPVVVGPNQASE